MNLVDTRARVREDLQDTDPLNYLWSNDEIDGAIDRVVREYSFSAPIEQQSDITSTVDSKEIDISTLTGLLRISSLEYPMDQELPRYQRFEFWAGKLYMEIEGDGVEKARIRWLKRHTLAAGSTTIPVEHQEIIVMGATGYLAMSASAYTVDRAAIAGHFASINYRTWGKERLDRYERRLKAVVRSLTLISKELYTDD